MPRVGIACCSNFHVDAFLHLKPFVFILIWHKNANVDHPVWIMLTTVVIVWNTNLITLIL